MATTLSLERISSAIHHLLVLATTNDLSAETVARLEKSIELLEREARAAAARDAGSADMTLVHDLERIYQRVIDETAGTSFGFPEETSEAVKAAASDWAAATGQSDHPCLSQRRLEELELDAEEIRAKVQRGTKVGTPRHAAVVMAEHVFGIPERTSYDRMKKGTFAMMKGVDPLEEAREDAILFELRVALAISAASGLALSRAKLQAKEIVGLALEENAALANAQLEPR